MQEKIERYRRTMGKNLDTIGYNNEVEILIFMRANRGIYTHGIKGTEGANI